MINIKSNFDFDAIRKRLNNGIDQKIQKTIEAYKAAGKQFVDRARANKGFGNITHNLVSSMGCILIVNHQRVYTYFPVVNGGDEGAKNGLAYASEIGSYIDDGGVILICVAGESYARAVEDRGKDVISGTDLHFADILTKELKKVSR